MNTTSDGGNQNGRGLRGDPVAHGTASDGTRDPQSSSVQTAEADLTVLRERNAQLEQQVEALKRVMEDGAFDEFTLRHYGKQALTNRQVRMLIERAEAAEASLASLRHERQVPQEQGDTRVESLS